jgi:hypothetical protein
LGAAALPTHDLKLTGVAMMAVAASCTLVGVGVGSLVDATAGGGFVGALIGVPTSLFVGWRYFVKPYSEASAARDFSHLSPKLDDDE